MLAPFNKKEKALTPKQYLMADQSEPLLLSADDSDVDHKTRPEALTFDNIVILVGVALFFDAQQIFITVYTDAYPTWHCLNHTICDHSTSDICRLPRSAWEWDGGSKDKTVISDFGLECSSSLLRGMPTSAFYIGGIVGGFVLALIPDDSLGRKKLVLFSTFAMSITSISVIFSTNVWIYTTLKFIIGFSRSQTWSYALVLISERVSTRWRPRATMIPFTFFVLGFMSLSGIAFLAQHSSWRFLYLYTAVPAIFYCIFLYIFALESPRWLHMQGNDEEAINFLSYLRSKKPLKNCQVVMIILFGLGISYYGVPLAARDIDVNIYLSETLNAVVELPTFIITPIILERFNRRSSVLVNTLLGGASGVLCFVLSLLGKTGIAFAFELATFFCARIGFNLMAVYMVEMFPTCVRSSATMMFRQALVVGGACCPLIASIGRDLPSVSFAIFGVAMSGFGLFVLVLPETKGSSLCDTMEEQEKRDQTINTSHSLTPKQYLMADQSEPLLLSADDSDVDHKTRPEALTFDNIVILVGVALFFDAQQIFITVYTDAYPTSAWEWDGGSKDKTVISDFGLECSSSLLRGMPTSAFYIGGIVGGFVLALIPDDSLGRKKLFIIGFSRSQTWSYALVLISERVSTRWRPRATMIPFTFFVLGFMSLSGIAFLAQHSSWRFLYLYTAVPAIFYCIFLYIFALESPRWLHMQGNDEEAINHVIQEQTLLGITIVMIILFGLGISYYGVPLAARDIDVNIYLSETLNAVVELPTFIITPIILERFNRRSSVLVNTLLGGASGVLCFVLSLLGKTGIAFAFELATFFCARIGFNLMAVYMVEMFPTCVRSSATMMFRQALVVGGACCPLIASIGRDLPSVSFAIFGVAMSGFGLFVLVLPETKGSSLCDTMEEQEKRDQTINTSHSLTPKQYLMADQSEPLLLSADDSDVDHKTRPEALTFDNIVILVGVALFFDAQQIFITVYTDAYPTSAWEWDGGSKDKTVISDFGLECSSSLLRGMPTSAFYIGGIVGGFVLALIPDDSLGRKKLFIIGFSRSQTWSYALVLISERVSTRWRPRATMIPFTFFVLGFMSLSGIAFLAQHSSWRFLYLYTAVPAIFYCIFLYIFALESPRWLHMQGNDEEAINVLKSMSSKNKPYLESLVSQLPPEQETSEELPRFNRRSSVLVNTLLGGASGVLCFVLSLLGKTGIAFAFELATFFCARIGFNLMAVYMVEMFPTCVRSSATMMFRQALVVGGACCPLIASIGRDLPSVSFAIFGVAMSGFGLFVLVLPETKGSSLCDTMEEQEKRDQTINTSH
ncbi:hypothetical protein HID58_065039, partial [Brassica napus]